MKEKFAKSWYSIIVNIPVFSVKKQWKKEKFIKHKCKRFIKMYVQKVNVNIPAVLRWREKNKHKRFKESYFWLDLGIFPVIAKFLKGSHVLEWKFMKGLVLVRHKKYLSR